MYGPETVPWHAIAPVYEFLMNLGSENRTTAFDAPAEIAGTGYGLEAFFLQQIERYHRQGGPYGAHLHDWYWPTYGAKTDLQKCVAYIELLLTFSRYFSVTHSIDRICAVLGLLTPFWPDSEPPLITPDYRLSPAQFNQAFTSELIKLAPRLTVLSLVEDPSERQVQDMPSWVPLYSSTMLVSTAILAMKGAVDCLAGVEFDKSQVAISASRLSVKGWRCDTIVDAAPMIALGDVPFSKNHSTYVQFFEACLRFYPHLDPLYINGESAATALVRASSGPCVNEETRHTLPETFTTFMAGMLGVYLAETRSAPENSELDEEGRASVHRCIRALADIQLVAGLPSVSLVEEHAATFQRLDFSRAEWEQTIEVTDVEFVSCHARALIERRFFMSESKLLGIGTRSIRPGDEIWMIPGSPIPMTLRPTGRPTDYTLLGRPTCMAPCPAN